MEGKILEKPDVRQYDDSLSDYNLKFNEILKTTMQLKAEFKETPIYEQISRLESELKNVGHDKTEFN